MIQATQLLINDHKTVKGLFRQFEAVNSRVRELEPDVVREMIALLEIHSKLEEEIFYPACQQALTAGENAKVEEYLADHADLDRTLASIRQTLEGADYNAREFTEQVRDMIETVEAHIEKEERDLLPEIEAKLPQDKLTQLGGQLEERKAQLLEMPEYQAAKARPAQYPNGGEQSRKEAA